MISSASSNSDMSATSPPSSGPHCSSRYSWPQPASGIQDRIELFESDNHEQAAGNIQSKRRRRKWCSSSNIIFYVSSDDQEEEKEEESEAEMISSRPSREMNQELNNQLRVKADELMRMFIEHKRRTDSRHCASSSSDSYNGNGVARGEFYERYMEKRDEKRRNEWRVKREEKDAKMWAMWESVETTWARMNAMRKNDQVQQTVSLIEEEEDRLSNDGSLKSVNSKMLNSRSMPSSSSRLSQSYSISKPPTKPPTSRSLRISSTPNSDARKENMKPSIGTVPRSKSTSSKINHLKEEKSFLKKGDGVTRSSKLRTSSISYPSKIIYCDDSLDTRSFSSTKDNGRARKKWESVEMHEEVVGDHEKGVGSKGFKRFLSFGRRSGKLENRVIDDCCEREVGFSFSEGMKLPKQATTPRTSTPSSANFKLKKDHLSQSSPKSPRSFFSLSSFRNKGVESKLR